MLKGSDNRVEELKALGWSAEDLRKYEELWEYRQRWGAINLELEDRVFLRQAEAALPKRAAHGKGGGRKTIQEKSHYRWLSAQLEAMRSSPVEAGLENGRTGAWPIVLEEELRALAYYQPVLGLPDTLKAKALIPARERWVEAAAVSGETLSFDFPAALEAIRQSGTPSWKSLRSEAAENPLSYPVLDAEAVASFRATVRQEVLALTRSTFPSLAETSKPEPPDDWQPSS
ncbi:hypothetical protein KQ304_13515 [Synechococcus sp. CS-1329]|uniref:hypothetical protein n=1 Tax=Synechococcus sp. CS-1329 TaxID=2847975 RepID=UPI00223B7FBE|nr:hypothetical protein [Synechococcus sp. CS-1329]MCT0219995.1 hypothetical protein [Synechococcus sp. CS-1329]